jgi:isopenicillin-N epimerase
LSLAALWSLDPAVTYLNHGSFGACPTAILEIQAALRREMEREPVDFFAATFQARIDAAREQFSIFLGTEPADLAFVPNATAGINAVLRSLPFKVGDEILLTNHTYNACRKTIEFVAARTGLRPVIATLPFPCRDEDAIVAPILERVSKRTRLALLDHVTSPTALVLPLARLIKELNDQGVDTLVDGAHAPGMVPLDLATLGAAYYTGNAHKWLCAPKGAAFLHVRRDRQPNLHPTAISHGYATGFHGEFDWTGTFDPTPWLCIPEAVRFMGSLLPGGWAQVMATNRALALSARNLLLESLELEPPCPDSMIGSMASIAVPLATPGAPADGLDFKAIHDWFRARGVETWLYCDPVLLLRISAQLYNNLEQFKQLNQLLMEALRGG